MHKTNTLDLVPLSLGKSAFGFCWVYKIETKSHGWIERYKSFLVKVLSQYYGMDYEENFAHLSNMTIICTIIAVSPILQWNISKMDVKRNF